MILPAGITSIGQEAFSYCSLPEHFYLPLGLKEIGLRSFTNCNGLKHLYIPASVDKIERFVPDWPACEMEGFDHMKVVFHDFDDLTVHAPKGSLAEQYVQDENIWIREYYAVHPDDWEPDEYNYIKFIPWDTF